MLRNLLGSRLGVLSSLAWGLLHKLNSILPKQYYLLLKLYLSDRRFRIRQEGAYSGLREMRAGVPQGSVLEPVLYMLYTNCMLQSFNITIATFVDDTALVTVSGTNLV